VPGIAIWWSNSFGSSDIYFFSYSTFHFGHGVEKMGRLLHLVYQYRSFCSSLFWGDSMEALTKIRFFNCGFWCMLMELDWFHYSRRRPDWWFWVITIFSSKDSSFLGSRKSLLFFKLWLCLRMHYFFGIRTACILTHLFQRDQVTSYVVEGFEEYTALNGNS